MKNVIEINIEIDASGKKIFIGENNSSGVEKIYDNFKEISKHIEDYIEMYHKQEIEESGRLMTIKNDTEFIYQFLKEQNDTEWIDLEKLKILQDKEYVLPGDTPIDLQKRLDKMLETLWEALEDVPFCEIDGVEVLDDDYLDFEFETTTKEDIWHWFDERYSKGVHYLLYEFENEDEKKQIEENSPICTTNELIEELKKINILEYEKLQKIAYRLEMLDKNYTFHLKENILDKAEVIKFNNLDKTYSSDEVIKNELIEEIEDIAADYGVVLDDSEKCESL